MNDHSELKRLAEAATPGEWQAYDTHGKRFIESMVGEAHVVCDTPKKQWLKDSEFIAAANPPVVLSMIAEIKRLTELLECAQGDLKQAMQIIEKNGKDAERYRWLRDPDNQEDLEPDSDYLMPPIIFGYAEHEDILAMESLDQAIDAAMSKEG